MFTFNQVRIADAWGTTNLPLEAPLPGSLLLVVGDQSRSHMWQFLLIVHHFRLRIFHLFSHCSFKERRSKYLYHRYTPYWWTSHPADSESECGSQSRQAWKTNSWTESFCYHGDCGQGPHCLFPDGKAYWAFQRQTETLNTSMQFSEVTADSIWMVWMNFQIPFEFPPIMDHFISFDKNHSHLVKDESINALPKYPISLIGHCLMSLWHRTLLHLETDSFPLYWPRSVAVMMSLSGLGVGRGKTSVTWSS